MNTNFGAARLAAATIITLVWAAGMLLTYVDQAFNPPSAVTPVMLAVATWLFRSEIRDHHPDNGRTLMVAMVVVAALVASVLGIGVLHNADRIAALGPRVDRAACQRVQILRNEVNTHNILMYEQLRAAATRPGQPLRWARFYARLARQVNWTPPTDCTLATVRPEQTVVRPVPMSVHLDDHLDRP